MSIYTHAFSMNPKKKNDCKVSLLRKTFKGTNTTFLFFCISINLSAAVCRSTSVWNEGLVFYLTTKTYIIVIVTTPLSICNCWGSDGVWEPSKWIWSGSVIVRAPTKQTCFLCHRVCVSVVRERTCQEQWKFHFWNWCIIVLWSGRHRSGETKLKVRDLPV